MNTNYSEKLKHIKSIYESIKHLSSSSIVEELFVLLDQLIIDREHNREIIESLHQTIENITSELFEYKRDKRITYLASDRPQNSQMVHDYKTLKEQHLGRLASKLFKEVGLINIPTIYKKNEKYRLNKIRSLISRELLVRGQLMMQGERVESIPLDSLLSTEICKCIGTKLNILVEDESIDKIQSLVTTKMGYTLTPVGYPKPGAWQEEDFTKATEEILIRLYHVFNLSESSIDSALCIEMQHTIRECLKFVENVARTDSPGTFCFEPIGIKFDPNCHEKAIGSPSDIGVVIETVYPSYTVENQVLVDAQVWIDSELTDSQSIDKVDMKSPLLNKQENISQVTDAEALINTLINIFSTANPVKLPSNSNKKANSNMKCNISYWYEKAARQN